MECLEFWGSPASQVEGLLFEDKYFCGQQWNCLVSWPRYLAQCREVLTKETGSKGHIPKPFDVLSHVTYHTQYSHTSIRFREREREYITILWFARYGCRLPQPCHVDQMQPVSCCVLVIILSNPNMTGWECACTKWLDFLGHPFLVQNCKYNPIPMI